MGMGNGRLRPRLRALPNTHRRDCGPFRPPLAADLSSDGVERVHRVERNGAQLLAAVHRAVSLRCGRGRRVSRHGPGGVLLDPHERTRHGTEHQFHRQPAGRHVRHAAGHLAARPGRMAEHVSHPDGHRLCVGAILVLVVPRRADGAPAHREGRTRLHPRQPPATRCRAGTGCSVLPDGALAEHVDGDDPAFFGATSPSSSRSPGSSRTSRRPTSSTR